jgi:DDE superfamily endonuclease
MLVMPGRVTRLGIACWADQGGSYRTVQHVFSQALPGAMLLWGCFRQHGHRPEEGSLLAGDEGVVTNAGKHPYGRDRFFARLSGTPIPGIACFAFWLVSVQARRAFPVRVEPVGHRAAEKAATQATAAATPQPPSTPSRRPGRPQGSRHTPQTAVPLTPTWSRLTAMLEALLKRLVGVIPLTSLGLDGHFGHRNALPMTRQNHLHLSSTRRSDAALSFP